MTQPPLAPADNPRLFPSSAIVNAKKAPANPPVLFMVLAKRPEGAYLLTGDAGSSR